jgi:SAM-dependent methyltransferase
VGGEIPIPPVDLTARLRHGPRTEERRAGYLDRGALALEAIERLLPAGWEWAGKRVLDFGCGAGRVIRHLIPPAPGCELWGSDIDPRCIEWDRRHLGPASFVLNGERPPLPFDDGGFDLIYAVSVFTHISDLWASWLLEMHRVLAPGGLLVATFMGEGMCEPISGEPFDEERIGMNVYEAGQDWSRGGPMVLHSPWWIEEHWGRLFAIERLLPSGFIEDAAGAGGDDHGAVLLRRASAAAPTAGELERIDPAEPREATALHHDIRHLRAEVAGLRARLSGRSTAGRG